MAKPRIDLACLSTTNQCIDIKRGSMAAQSSGLVPFFQDQTARYLEYASKELFQGDFHQLIANLRELEKNTGFPKIYMDTVLRPFIEYLEKHLGFSEFNRIIQTSNDNLTSQDVDLKELIRDVAEALLQRDASQYPAEAQQDLEAFQAIISTIYQATAASDFLYASPPPLCVWTGARELSSLAMTIDTTQRVHINAEIICLNPRYRDVGLLVWTTVGHEMAAHHLLRSHADLIPSIKEVVLKQLVNNQSFNERYASEKISLISHYLSERITAIASDILGVLNIGPSSTIGLICYLRGIKDGVLKNEGSFSLTTTRELKLTYPGNSLIIDLEMPLDDLGERGVLGYVEETGDEVLYEQKTTLGDPYPIDVLRPYTMLKVIELLKIDEKLKNFWKILIKKELERDLKGAREIRLLRERQSTDVLDDAYDSIPLDLAVEASEIAAEIIASDKHLTLHDRSFMDLVHWNSIDEGHVANIRNCLQGDSPSIALAGGGTRHVVAAAILESMEHGVVISKLFSKMKQLLALTLKPREPE